MSDVEFHNLWQGSDDLGRVEIEPVAGVNFQTFSPREKSAELIVAS